MRREDLIRNPGYWTAKAQFDLYACAENYMRSHNMNRTQLAEYLGVSKGYVSQLLNGDYDHKLSKLVELSIAFDVVPKIEFQPIHEAINEDWLEYNQPVWHTAVYQDAYSSNSMHFCDSGNYEVPPTDLNTLAA